MTAALLALLLNAGPPALPPAVVAEAIGLRDAARAGTGAAARVRSLTDGVGPRLTGSPGSVAAVAWALEQLRGAGLENVHAEPVLAPQWVRGVETAELLGPSPQRLVLTALGGSVGTRPEGLTAQVVQTESLESLAALLKAHPDAVRGKVVFFSQRMPRTRDIAGYAHAVPVRGLGPSAAAKAGAVAVLLRSVGTNASRVPHTGVLRYDEDAPRIPAAALAPADAELLERLGPGPLAVHLTLTCATLAEVQTANVIGELRGREHPEEVVLLGAHLDSWDLGQGAVDDGAGVAVVLETAARLARLPRHPRRTLRVVLYANEENGARGAQGYVLAHQAELANHIAALESDLGQDPAYALAHQAGPEAEPALAELAALLAPLGIAGPGGDEAGVDVGFLKGAGVPLLNLDQDASEYFDLHHSADDTFEKIVPAHLDQLVAAYLTVAAALLEMPGTLGRVPEARRK